MKKVNKIILSIGILVSLQAKAQINVSESFEIGSSTAELSSGFTSTTFSGTYAYAQFGTGAGSACDGVKEIFRPLAYSGGADDWYLTYSSTASNGQALSYSLYYLAKPFSETTHVLGSVGVQYSVNNGSTWTSLHSFGISDQNGVSFPCTLLSGTIPAGVIPAGSSFKFRLSSNYISTGKFDMGFDKIVLSQATLGTEDFNDEIEIKAYPNPFKDILSITNINDVESVTVIDATGKIIETYVDPSQNLDLHKLEAGIYFINIKMKDGTTKTVKSIKK